MTPEWPQSHERVDRHCGRPETHARRPRRPPAKAHWPSAREQWLQFLSRHRRAGRRRVEASSANAVVRSELHTAMAPSTRAHESTTTEFREERHRASAVALNPLMAVHAFICVVPQNSNAKSPRRFWRVACLPYYCSTAGNTPTGGESL